MAWTCLQNDLPVKPALTLDPRRGGRKGANQKQHGDELWKN